MDKQQRAAIEAVARRFRATWEEGASSGVYFRVAGKRVTVAILTLKPRTNKGPNAAKPHLRFDKVATRMIEGLRASLGQTVPDGMTVLLTITAPICLASKTAGALEAKIQTLINTKTPRRDVKDTIHGNHVQIRHLKHRSGHAPRLIGFVHNPDTDPLLLLNMTEDLLELAQAQAASPAQKNACDRWLVVLSLDRMSLLGAYRDIVSQLRMTTSFKKVLVVFSDGRVEHLTP